MCYAAGLYGFHVYLPTIRTRFVLNTVRDERHSRVLPYRRCALHLLVAAAEQTAVYDGAAFARGGTTQTWEKAASKNRLYHRCIATWKKGWTASIYHHLTVYARAFARINFWTAGINAALGSSGG